MIRRIRAVLRRELWALKASGLGLRVALLPALGPLRELLLPGGPLTWVAVTLGFATLLPITLGLWTIADERTSRSLEPLLASPLRPVELLVGKGAVILLWSVGATWAWGLAFELARWRLEPERLWPLLVLAPGLAALATASTLAVAVWVPSPRTAQQLLPALMLPCALLGLSVRCGLPWLLVSAGLALVGAGLAGAVAAAGLSAERQLGR